MLSFCLLLLLLSRFSRVPLCATPQTAAHQAPPSLGFSRQELWSGLPFPPLGDLPHPGIEPRSPVSPALPADSPLLSHWGSQSVQFSSVQSPSPVRLCDPMNRSTPGLPVHRQLPEFTQTHVHRVGNAIQPSHPLSSLSPPAPNASQHQSLFQ